MKLVSKTTPLVFSALAASALALLGCDDKGQAKSEAPSASTPAGSAAKAAAPSGVAAAPATGKHTGIDAPDNNPDLVKLVKQTLADCGSVLDEKDDGKAKMIYDCTPSDKLKPYNDAKFDKVAATCVNILEDDDAKVREMGVSCLGKWGWDFRSDKALAGRVFAALKKEKPGSPIDAQLADQIVGVSESTGLWDDLAAYAKKAETPVDVKNVIMAWWHGGEKSYDVVHTLAGTTDPKLQYGVVMGYALAFEKHTDEACKYYVAHLEAEDKDARSYAMGHLTGGWNGNTTHDFDSDWYSTGGGSGPYESNTQRCAPADVTKALDYIEKLGKTKAFPESAYTYSLIAVVNPKMKYPDALAKRARAIAKKLIEQKDFGSRSTLLDRLVNADPTELAYAQKFAADPAMKSTVEYLNKPKK